MNNPIACTAHWPEFSTTILWPLVLLATADRLINLHIDLDGKTLETTFSEAFGVTTNRLTITNFHTFD